MYKFEGIKDEPLHSEVEIYYSEKLGDQEVYDIVFTIEEKIKKEITDVLEKKYAVLKNITSMQQIERKKK